ncbi:hypothetical protein GIB67_006693 [Kingdonia uniflora]|uniref:Apyrase 6 n=1 Tax=Kingdonia uniflora TaxID=39325 RepID=A0A7J7LYU6_9MAGN|nr:hypothetical protein GIB67_006693 [Kingdonia uniflora]
MDSSKLQSRVSTNVPPHRTQLHPRMQSFSSISSSQNPKSNPISSSLQSREKWLVLLASLLIIPFVFYMFSMGRGIHQSSKFDDSKPKGFGIVIDSTNTGSTIHVFEFLNEGRIPFVGFDGKGSHSMKVRIALVEFEENTGNAGKSILSLLEFGKERVPKSEWRKTKVSLMATGAILGFELSIKKAILDSCRNVLRSSGFVFKDEWASLMTGQQQGVYAWVAANYALGTLGGDPQETTGIVELGGDSLKVSLDLAVVDDVVAARMQVIFALKEPPPVEFSRIVKLAGVTYKLYARSMLYFGQGIAIVTLCIKLLYGLCQDAAWKSLHELQRFKVSASSLSNSKRMLMNPCIPKGYPPITTNSSDEKLLSSSLNGNFSACKSEALRLLLKVNGEECSHPPCKIVSSFLPQLQGKSTSTRNFFYISKLFGMVPKASLSDMEIAGRHYCESDWDKLKDEHPGIDEMDLLRYCFSSSYILALLHDNLEIPMNDRRIGFANQAGSTPLDWTLGAFILQTTVVEPLELEPENIGHIDLITYFSLFSVLTLAVCAAFYVSKLRKPQLKTVYDLEKGHYIVTRLPM